MYANIGTRMYPDAPPPRASAPGGCSQERPVMLKARAAVPAAPMKHGDLMAVFDGSFFEEVSWKVSSALESLCIN